MFLPPNPEYSGLIQGLFQIYKAGFEFIDLEKEVNKFDCIESMLAYFKILVYMAESPYQQLI